MNALTDAETIAALRGENAMLTAALHQAESPQQSGDETFAPFTWLTPAAARFPLSRFNDRQDLEVQLGGTVTLIGGRVNVIEIRRGLAMTAASSGHA